MLGKLELGLFIRRLSQIGILEVLVNCSNACRNWNIFLVQYRYHKTMHRIAIDFHVT